MFHLCRNQVVGFTGKMFEKHLWKSDILSNDVGLAAFTARFLKCVWPFWDIIH